MKIRLFLIVSSLIASLNIAVAQTVDNYTVPRTEWDQPDLQGVWNFVSNTPMQRPERFGTREYLTPEEVEADRILQQEEREAADASEAELVINPQAPPAGANPGGYNNFWYERAGIGENVRTSLMVYPPNGRLPARVEGSAVHRANLGDDVPGERPVLAVFGGIGKDGPEDRGLSERCLVGFNSGPPFSGGGYNANVQIFQNKDHAVILTEMVHDARIVPLDGRDHVDEDLRFWTGDSRGYWEDDTLVVVSKNFSELTPSYSRYGTAKNKTLTERFTRVGPYTIDYEWTLDDPSTFTDKITAIIPMTKVAGQLYEYACHEGNYGMANILRGERMKEQRESETGN
jgi:hypothetical protein|tara:strand:- start:2538 stop:3569 length:1032 start_codon:yes stop_codon:yes gene_type:complete